MNADNRPIQCNETEQLLSNISSDESREKSEEKSHVRSRLWAVTYVCTVAIHCFFLLGFAAGFTSPVLSELSDEQDKYKSLRRKVDQDLFNVSITSLISHTYYRNYCNSSSCACVGLWTRCLQTCSLKRR